MSLTTLFTLQTNEKKTRLCHVNMLKLCSEKSRNNTFRINVPEMKVTDEKVEPVLSVSNAHYNNDKLEEHTGGCLNNTAFLNTLQKQLSYLDDDQKQAIIGLIQSYPVLFNDVPSCTSILHHDIDIGSTSPIKQHAYHCSVDKRNAMKAEVGYLLQNNLVCCKI